jgi:hypothetical protein
MKKIITLIIILCSFNLMILVSCESHDKKTDDAFEHIKKEKNTPKDSIKIIKESPKVTLVKRNENPNEWTIFKVETEKKILFNETKIKEIKNIPNADASLNRKVMSVEKNNRDLKRQLEKYQEEEKVKWEKFKLKMNQDMNEIDFALKDMIINGKK